MYKGTLANICETTEELWSISDLTRDNIYEFYEYPPDELIGKCARFEFKLDNMIQCAAQISYKYNDYSCYIVDGVYYVDFRILNAGLINIKFATDATAFKSITTWYII